MPVPLRVRHVVAGEDRRLRALRLAALAADPDAFGSTLARETGRPPVTWRTWAGDSGAGAEQRTFVLVDGVDGVDAWHGLARGTLVRPEPSDAPGSPPALAARGGDPAERDRDGRAVLTSMWVAPGARGRGGAGALCDAVADWAAPRGCHALVLTVVRTNTAAVRAYGRAGFTVTGRESRLHDGGRVLDEYLMSRSLPR